MKNQKGNKKPLPQISRPESSAQLETNLDSLTLQPILTKQMYSKWLQTYSIGFLTS